jgi:hypothetical protein
MQTATSKSVAFLLIKEFIVEWLRDGSGSPQRSEDYKRTARSIVE